MAKTWLRCVTARAVRSAHRLLGYCPREGDHPHRSEVAVPCVSGYSPASCRMDGSGMGLGGFGMWKMLMLFAVVLFLFSAKRQPPSGF